MSYNQSRGDKNDSQYRKSGGGNNRSGGSSGQHRPYSGGGSGGGSRGGGTTSAPTSQSSAPSPRQSYRKANNGQSGQSRPSGGHVNAAESNTGAAPRAAQNGAHPQPASHGASNVPKPAPAVKQTDGSTQKNIHAVPRALPSHSSTVTPTAQASTVTSKSTSNVPTTPVKAPGDAAKGFPLQFGSISPGFMNGMQIPARTSSAPPNLDEQKRDQAMQESARVKPAAAIPSAPKPLLPKQDVPSVDRTITEVKVDSKAKREAHPVPGSPAKSQRPSVPSTAGISMPISFHHQSSMQFGGPTQIPPQSLQGASLPMPMPISMQMGNPPPGHHPVFIPGLPHHMLQPQGIIHQGQNLGFNPQMGQQLPHQMGNLAVNMPLTFNQQAVSTRKAVKITHPDTHEELRLDKRTDVFADSGSSGSRQHHSLPQQSQAVPAYPPNHPISHYTNTYNGGPAFFPAPNPVSLTSAPITSGPHAPRYSYPVGQVQPNVPFTTASAVGPQPIKGRNLAHGTGEATNVDHLRNVQGMAHPQTASVPVTIKSAAGHIVSASITSEKSDLPKLLRPTGSSDLPKDSDVIQENSATHSETKELSASGDLSSTSSGAVSSSICASEEAASASSIVNDEKVESLPKPEPLNLFQEPGIKKHLQQAHQVDREPDTSLPHETFDRIIPSKSGLPELTETETKCDRASSEHAAASNVSGSVGDGFLVSNSPKVLHSEIEPTSTISEKFILLPEAPVGGTDVSSKDIIEHLAQDFSDLKDSQQSSVEAVVNVGKTSQDADINHRGVIGTHESDMPSNASPAEVSMSSSYTPGPDKVTSGVGDGDYSSTSSALLSRTDSLNDKEDIASSARSDNEAGHATALVEVDSRAEVELMEGARPTSSSGRVSGSTKGSLDPSRAKNPVSRSKKKRKEVLQKADAAGTTLDLYMAYKGPEEKKEASVAAESGQTASESDLKQAPSDIGHDIGQESEPSKAELDDWEDAADISTPRLESTGDDGLVAGKKYTRDFLLTFAEHYTDLPEGFEIASDTADILIRQGGSASRVYDRELPSPGRTIDRQTGGLRLDRHGSGMMDGDWWSKNLTPYPSGRDMGPDPGYGSNMIGIRTGQGGSHGVLRNPRAQPPVQHVGGILSGPVPSMGPQAGLQRNNSDSDRWQRGTNFQKGLMPPPQSPLVVMHKAEKKYEVGKVTDEEQTKQRTLKAILNKLTPQNFEKLFEQVKAVNIDNALTLAGVISQIFDKALMEPTFCEMYADFCYHLASELPDLSVGDEKITFKRLLLNKCQEEFERGEREEEEANKADNEGESKLSDAEREEKRLKSRRRMLGNIRLIGELFKKSMLTERIMHECIKKLLGQYQTPDEEDIEALCKLMSTIGEMIDHPKAKEHMDAYFDIMAKLSNNMKLSSRVRFMLKDAIDLRKNKWQQRRKVEGPKKIEEVHRDAIQERQTQTSRLSRAPSISSSMRRGQPVDFSPRGSSVLPSPVNQGSSFRGLPNQARGYGVQDPRFEERNVFESRTLSVPLSQRQFGGDDSITLGPQGGLARGMSTRGQPLLAGPRTVVGPGEGRRVMGGLNGYSSASARATGNSVEEVPSRYPHERFGGPSVSDHSSIPDNLGLSNRDQRNLDRNFDSIPPALSSLPSQPPVQSEQRLREMSMATIKEFYSAKDEKEVALCIKDLNAPSFYSSLISIWVTDSFERKDMERDLLAKLLVNLAKPHEGMFKPVHLTEGFESVLANLEDTVNDAPRAAEFLGRLFGRVIVENVVSLGELGRLIYEGGEEPGRLREVGLAGDVLGSILETIKSDQGESVLNDIRGSSNLRLEDFRPLGSLKSRKLEMFI
ncbi:hypothetical protein Drorol1_Dr00005082 [Drosera rotundifolia]